MDSGEDSDSDHYEEDPASDHHFESDPESDHPEVIDPDSDHSEVDPDSNHFDVNPDSDHSEADPDSDHSEVDANSDHSDHPEVIDPAHAARAALLVARFAAAIQATKELQALHNRPQLLEKLVLKCLDTGDAAAFLNQKRIFRMMPGRLLEKINRELGPQWRRLPLVGVMANPRTRHLSLHLEQPPVTEGEVEGWSLQELEQLCQDVARECKSSLLGLQIRSFQGPTGSPPGLHSSQVGSLLLELRALTSLHLVCYFVTYEIDLLVCILASTNPDIRSLRLPHLSNKSLMKIADRWPQLEALYPDQHEFDSSHLEAVLPRLRNLEKLRIYGEFATTVLLSVARAHDPASPPYKLAGEFSCHMDEPLSSEDMVKVFTAFPALHWLSLKESEIPAVCAGLHGREHVHITGLLVITTSNNPRALEPLLARVGPDVTDIEVTDKQARYQSRVDLSMIGHYCPNLEELKVYAGELISSDEFEVAQTPHFSKLKLCAVRHNSDVNGLAQLPGGVLCRVLSRPTLERADLRGVPVTEELVAALAEERGALSSLQELSVWYHASQDVGVLAELVSLASRLGQLTLNTDEGEEEDQGFQEMRGVLTSFLQQSELRARVTVDTW